MSDQNLNDSGVIVVSSDTAKDYVETVSCSCEHIIADNLFSRSCHLASRLFSEEVHFMVKPDFNEIKLTPDLEEITSRPSDSITCALFTDVLTENNIFYLINNNNNIGRACIERVDHLDQMDRKELKS